ncbi:NAD-dependent epimerase/dehydratase family protein [Owenweeksia hongkongensis]|uniref:NAD-dependent epimerase/dehydratase family protein n=1 Tax=Owenweeksia hongkongensis TaxID=253245 RepID=UPI003A8F16B6
MDETILVTGVTGMLGAHVLYELTSAGKAVRAAYRNEAKQDLVAKIFSYYTDSPQQLLDKVHWVKADLMNIADVEDAMFGISEVYHCAALVSFDDRDDDKLMSVNPQTTANVVNVALEFKIRKLVHVSSVAALGRATQGKPIDEKAQWVESKHNSVYAKSKYLSELEVWRATEEGLDAVIVNPTIILGPGNWKEGSAAIFNTVAKGFKFYTEGVNGYVDARDVAAIMVKLMASNVSAQRFVAVGENVSYREVFNQIAEELNAPKPTVHAKPWMGNIVWRIEKVKSILFGGRPMITEGTAKTSHQKNYYTNNKVQKELDFEFRPLRETIKDLSAFYKQDYSS